MPSVNMNDVRAELEEIYSVRQEVDNEAKGREAVGDAPPSIEGTQAEANTQAPPPVGEADSTQSDTTQQSEQAQPVDWERRYKDMERRFKAVQSAITPAQQERAALRKEVESLKSRLAEMTPTEERDVKVALERAREVLPEAVAPIENALNRVEQLEAAMAARERENQQSTIDSVMNEIKAAHPDAFSIAENDEGFWKFVDAHEEGATLRSILEQPWNFVHGTTVVNGLFQNYKEALASPRPHSASVPRPDVAPSVRGVPSPADVSSSNRPPANTTNQSLQRLDHKIRSASRDDLLKIREDIVRQAREMTERR